MVSAVRLCSRGIARECEGDDERRRQAAKDAREPHEPMLQPMGSRVRHALHVHLHHHAHHSGAHHRGDARRWA